MKGLTRVLAQIIQISEPQDWAGACGAIALEEVQNIVDHLVKPVSVESEPCVAEDGGDHRKYEHVLPGIQLGNCNQVGVSEPSSPYHKNPR